MFDKVAIVDDKIVIVKEIITWNETRKKPTITESNGEKIISEEEVKYSRSKYIISEEQKNKSIAYLTGKNIPYKITKVDIPESIKQYDGMDWTEGLDKAILFVNNDASVVIEQLKKQLTNMDYKTSKHADGEYTEEEWNNIVSVRKELRQKIRKLEKLIPQTVL